MCGPRVLQFWSRRKERKNFARVHQNAGQNHNIKTVNKLFKNAKKLKYPWTTVAYKHSVHKKTKSWIVKDNVRYHSVPKHWPYSSAIRTEIHKTVIVPAGSCEEWNLVSHISTLRTGDADLRFYITTVQDGWRKSAFLTRDCFPCTVHLIVQYTEPVSEWSCWRMFIETWPHYELTFRHRASSI